MLLFFRIWMNIWMLIMQGANILELTLIVILCLAFAETFLDMSGNKCPWSLCVLCFATGSKHSNYSICVHTGNSNMFTLVCTDFTGLWCTCMYSSVFTAVTILRNVFICSCFTLKKLFHLLQMSVPLSAHLFSSACYQHPFCHVARDTLEEHPPNFAASVHRCSSHRGHHAGHLL